MKIRIVSDLHFEFLPDRGVALTKTICQGEFDALVVAGDLADSIHLQAALERICQAAAPRPVFYVLGNHEYYHSSFPGVKAIMYSFEKQTKINNLFWLYRSDCLSFQSHRFIGTTLWFPSTGEKCTELNDFNLISDLSDELQTGLSSREKAGILRWGQDAANMLDTVIITHHLPHPRSIHPKYQGDSLNKYFLHDMSEFIENNQPALWIHGHTHSSCNYSVGDTQVVCNPYGYRGENSDFDPTFTVCLP